MSCTLHCYDVRTFLIYIESYENNILVGHYYNLGREEMGYFQSMTQLLMRIDESLDVENMPQSYHEMRTFSNYIKGWWSDIPDSDVGMGKLASFEIRVLFRRNSSWQGSLVWLEEGRSQSFRSVLELIFLINSALESRENLEIFPWDEQYDELAT